MKEMVMKKIISVIVGFFMLFMFSGVALSGDQGVPEKQKSAKSKKVHLKKSEYTSGPHITVYGGTAFLTDSEMKGGRIDGAVDTHVGYALGVAVGQRLKKNKSVRMEAELGYQKNNVDHCVSSSRDTSGDLKAYSLLVNGYYDFVKGKKIVPFITAGIGVAKVDADVNNIVHVDDVGLAYQVGAGVYYTITDNWHIELKYRYFGTAEFEGLKIYNTNPEFESNNVLLGVRYRF